MKNYFLAFVILLTAITSCNNSSGKKPESEFQNFKNEIPFLKLPLASTCEDNPPAATLSFSDSVIVRFSGMEYSKVYGKIADNSTYTAIIFLGYGDGTYQMLNVYDSTGIKIDSFSFFTSYCGGDGESYNFHKAEIRPDLTFSTYDSIADFDRDTLGEVIESSIRESGKAENYRIDKTGHIVHLR